MKFLTRIWHPNIAVDGAVCLDMLKLQWSPKLSLEKIISALLAVMANPNPDFGMNSDALALWRNDRKAFDMKVKAHISEHCIHQIHCISDDEITIEGERNWPS